MRMTDRNTLIMGSQRAFHVLRYCLAKAVESILVDSPMFQVPMAKASRNLHKASFHSVI